MPSESPSVSAQPSSMPSEKPSISGQPSSQPSTSPTSTEKPSSQPSGRPSVSSAPSSQPSGNPSASGAPSSQPSGAPSLSAIPTSQPSGQPSMSGQPSSQPSTSPTSTGSPSSEPSSLPSTSASPSMVMRKLYCGSRDRCDSNNVSVPAGDLHPVRCCTLNANRGSNKCDVQSDPIVYGQSRVPRCVFSVSFYDAVSTCDRFGGRLCSGKELDNNCASGTGCRLNPVLVWGCTESGDQCVINAECCSGKCVGGQCIA